MHKMDSDVYTPKPDTLKKRISLIGHKMNISGDSQDYAKTSRSIKKDPVLSKPSFSSENESLPVVNSNSGTAKVENSFTQLASSANLKPSRTKHIISLPEAIKHTHISQSVEKIGKSLESPIFFEKHIGQEPPVRLDERKINDVYSYSYKTSPTEQKIRANRWKMLEGLFNGKKREPKIVPTQSRNPSSPKLSMASKQVQASNSGSPEAEENERMAPANSYIGTKSRITYPREEAFQRCNISPIKFDNQHLERSSSKDFSPILDVEIPNIKLDRYSVMFSGLLQNPPSNVPSFNARQRANIEKFKKINEELAMKERELDEKSKRLEQIASSSDLLLKLNPVFSSKEKSSSILVPNNQQDISPNFSQSNEFSTYTSSSCSSLDFEASYETNYPRPESTSGNGFYNNAKKNMRSPFELPEVPQGFKLGLTSEQCFKFGFSDFLVEGEIEDFSSSFLDVKQSKGSDINSQIRNEECEPPFFSPNSSLDSLPSASTSKTSMNSPLDNPTSAVKKLISSDSLSELWNLGHEPYLCTSISSSNSSSSSPISNKSSIIPLSVSSSTRSSEGTHLEFLPHYDAVSPSCISTPSVVTTCTADPKLLYQSTGKSAYSSRVPRTLKRAQSSKRSESRKASIKPSLNNYQKKSKLSSPTILSQYPNLKQSSTVNIASKVVGSPLDAFALATNEELAHFICPSRTGAKELPHQVDSSFLNQHKFKEQLIISAKPRLPDVVFVDEDGKQMRETELPFSSQSCNKILEDIKLPDSYNIGVIQNDGHISHDGTPKSRGVACQSRKSHHVFVERISFSDT